MFTKCSPIEGPGRTVVNNLKRDIEDDVLPPAQRANTGVIMYSPMGSGLLSGRMTRPEPDRRGRRGDRRLTR
ncbi:MAG TPA: hypothetical protein VG164_11275 [Trebonia sp.]|nr:hypothetical protein [Trebonia sp.]